MKRVMIITIGCLLLLKFGFGQAINESLHNEAYLSVRNALKYLEKTQKDDGSWNSYPAITALAVMAFLKSPFSYTEATSWQVAKAIQFILSNQKPDGGIYADDQKVYNTSICLIALVATKNSKYQDAIRKARDFIISSQLDEGDGFTASNSLYGGIGYNEKKRSSDLSNLAWALESLKESEQYRKVGENNSKPLEFSQKAQSTGTQGVSSNKELFWEKALQFVQRCQNFKKTNDQAWSGNDGGFIYSPNESKAGEFTSYGSMSYAGLKSYIYAGLTKEDERVKAVIGWLKNNYTLEVNPQMGVQGLFYYYHTLAKALKAYGESVIVDSSGKSHEWRREFSEKMLTIQNGEGWWANANNRWMENNKELVTSYVVLALEEVLD